MPPQDEQKSITRCSHGSAVLVLLCCQASLAPDACRALPAMHQQHHSPDICKCDAFLKQGEPGVERIPGVCHDRQQGQPIHICVCSQRRGHIWSIGALTRYMEECQDGKETQCCGQKQ
jgi:hypothetical protein